MARTDSNPNPDGDLGPILRDVWREYQLLTTYIRPGQASYHNRNQPGSRPPLDLDPVSHMAAIEQFAHWWVAASRYIRNPPITINLTTTTGAHCPYCDGELLAYLQRRDPDAPQGATTRPDEVVCTNPDHLDTMGPARWPEADWSRLGVMTGVRIDARYGARYGARLHAVDESA